MLLYVKGIENDKFYNRVYSSDLRCLNGAMPTIFSVRTPLLRLPCLCRFLGLVYSGQGNGLDL